MIRLIITFALLLGFQTLNAEDKKIIQIDCAVIKGGVCSIVEGSTFVSLNGSKIPFYSTNGNPDNRNISHGKFDTKTLLVGDNLFEYSFINGGNKAEYIKKQYSIKLLPDIELFTFLREGIYPAKISGQTFKKIGLENIDPQLAARVVSEREKFYSTSSEYERYEYSNSGQITNLKREVEISQNNYRRCLEIVNSNEWQQLNAESLEFCEEAKNVFSKLKLELEKTNDLLKGQKESIQNSLNNRADQIGKIIKKFDIPTDDNSDTSFEDMNWDTLAERVTGELERSYGQQDREEFINIAKNWINASKSILNNSSLSIRALGKLKQTNQKVDSYIFSKVDQNFWFKDVEINEETKNNISGPIARINPAAANKIKAEINKWGRPLTELEHSQIEALNGLAQILQGTTILASNAVAIPKKISNAINEMAIDIGKGTACLAGNTVLNDWGDAFELFTGRDRCNYELKKTPIERAFSGLGLVIGTGTAWKKIFSGGEVYQDLDKLSSRIQLLHIDNADEATAFANMIKAGPKKTAKELEKLIDSIDEIEFFGPFKSGPLHLRANGAVADTFRSGQYFRTRLNSPKTLYRVYGVDKVSGKLNKLGGYWTSIKPSGPFEATINSALNPEWSTIVGWVEISVPAGTEYFEGVVAPQLLKSASGKTLGGLIGGGNQIYIESLTETLLKDWKKAEGIF